MGSEEAGVNPARYRHCERRFDKRLRADTHPIRTFQHRGGLPRERLREAVHPSLSHSVSAVPLRRPDPVEGRAIAIAHAPGISDQVAATRTFHALIRPECRFPQRIERTAVA